MNTTLNGPAPVVAYAGESLPASASSSCLNVPPTPSRRAGGERDVEAEQLALFDRPIVQPAMIRGATLAQRWEAFHKLNPQVFAAIERQALRLAAQGERRIGVKAIAEDLRRGRLATTGDDWKVNNSWPAFYARLLVKRHPGLEGVIEMRRAVADEVAA